MRLAPFRVDVGGNRNVNTRPPASPRHHKKKQALVRGVNAIGAATTQLTPRVLWTPGDARQYADDINGMWTGVESAIAAGTSASGKPYALMAAFVADLTAWSTFYTSSSDWTLWWNSGELDAWQDTINAWRDKVSAAYGTANLPPGGPSQALAALSSAQTVGTWVLGIAIVGGVGWLAWPWIVSAVKRSAPRKKNPRRRRR